MSWQEVLISGQAWTGLVAALGIAATGFVGWWSQRQESRRQLAQLDHVRRLERHELLAEVYEDAGRPISAITTILSMAERGYTDGADQLLERMREARFHRHRLTLHGAPPKVTDAMGRIVEWAEDASPAERPSAWARFVEGPERPTRQQVEQLDELARRFYAVCSEHLDEEFPKAPALS